MPRGVYKRTPRTSTEDLIRDLQACSRALGRTAFSSAHYMTWRGRAHSPLTFYKRFGKWKVAMAAAGLQAARHPKPLFTICPRCGYPGEEKASVPARQNGGCLRCGGLMKSEPVLDGDARLLTQWRCMNCGDVLDEKIVENRKLQAPERKRLHGQWPPPAPEKHNRRLGAVAL
jgi:hypothetical protein